MCDSGRGDLPDKLAVFYLHPFEQNRYRAMSGVHRAHHLALRRESIVAIPLGRVAQLVNVHPQRTIQDRL
jgi:hypothetical protein